MLTPMMKNSKIFKDFQSKVIIDNVQDLIDNEKSLSKERIFGGTKMTWDDYYSYDEVSYGL